MVSETPRHCVAGVEELGGGCRRHPADHGLAIPTEPCALRPAHRYQILLMHRTWRPAGRSSYHSSLPINK